MEGAPKRPVAATPPAHRGDTDGHPIALIVALQVPVRTQGTPPGRPHGRRRAAAYGPRVGGPDPADTPANGGSRRAAPPWRLTERMASGQRSTDPSGAGDQTAPGLQTPRSWAAACVTSFCSEVRHQDAPPAYASTQYNQPRRGGRPPPHQRWGPRRNHRDRGRREATCLAGKMGEDGRGRFLERSQPTLAFTYTLRPPLGPHRHPPTPLRPIANWPTSPAPRAPRRLHLAVAGAPTPPPRSLGGSLPPTPGLAPGLFPSAPHQDPGANWPTSPVRRRPGPPAPPSSWVSDPRPGGLAPPPLGAKPPKGGVKGFSRRAASHENARPTGKPPGCLVPARGGPGRPPSPPRAPWPRATPRATRAPSAPRPRGGTPLYATATATATATLRLQGGAPEGHRAGPAQRPAPYRLSDLPWALIVRECVPASESGWGGAVFSYFAIFAARPTGHGPSRRDAAKTLGQLARPGGGARPAWPSREAPPSQAPGQLAASSSGPRGPKSLDQLAGRDRHRRLALSSAPHPKTAGQLARSLARGSDPRGQGPGSETPLQAPGAAGPQQGYLTAYTTRLVTSVVCRGFIPARGDIAIRQPAPEGFSPGAVASLLRFRARRPIRIQLRRAGLHRRVPARILT
ncbi:hypothetical protein HFD88_009474 [Aspergillus terreus]|nr:hypothetical protein HFD88_009474 [Aspergillus terreus]